MFPNCCRGNTFFLILCFFLVSCDTPEEQAQSYFERGVKFVEGGDLVKASLDFRNALKLKEDFVPPLYELGKIERTRQNFEQAIKIFANVAERDPQHLASRIDLASILLLAGQLDGALKYADQALAIDGSAPAVLTLKGAIALKRENASDAIRFANTALKTDPDNADALVILAAERLSAGDLQGSLALLEKGTGAHQRNLGFQLFKMRVLEAMKDRDGVEGVFLQLAALFPDNSSVHFGLARWYFAADRKDEARRVVREFSAANPGNVEAGLQSVELVFRAEGLEAARRDLQSRIELGHNVFEYRMALANLEFSHGEYSDAVGIIKGVIDESGDMPNAFAARVRLAQMMLAKGERQEAGALLDDILEQDSKNADALMLRGGLSNAENRYDAAIKDLHAGLSVAPQSIGILRLLGEAYERKGSVELAEEQLVKAARIDNYSPRASLGLVRFLLRYGKAGQAERVLVQARSASPRDRQVLTALAQLKLRNQDWIGAEEIAGELRKLEDGGDTADQVLAASLSGQSKHEESIGILQKVLSGAQNRDAPLVGLVRGYILAKRYDEAQVLLKTTLEGDPKNIQAHVLQGTLHTLNGNADMAEASYRTAIEVNPKNLLVHRALAEFQLREKNLGDAEKTLRRGLEHLKGNPSLRLLLAVTLEQAGKYEAAINEYEAIIKLQPQSTIVANNLASLLSERRGDIASLDRAFEIASRFRRSEVPQFLDTLGWIHHLRGEHVRAVTLLKTAAERLPQMGVVQYHLGMSYKELGQKDLAIKSLQNAAAVFKGVDSPDSEKVRLALKSLEP